MAATAADARESAPSAASITAVPVRHWGRWVSAALVLGALGALVVAIAQTREFDFAAVPRYQFDAAILQGLRATIILSLLAQLVGVVLGVLLAVMRLSKNPVLSGTSWFYIWFFRGTPVLVQLIFWFNIGLVFSRVRIGVPFTEFALLDIATNDLISGFTAALLGLGLNEGAYMAEIVRAGIISVDQGQTEAAHALGMTHAQTMRRIVLPQAMRVIVPPTGNEFISMLKTTSLVVVIAGGELLTRAGDIYSGNFLVLELLVVASIWYLVLTSVASVIQYYVERRFARGAQRELPDTPLQRIWRNLVSGRGAARA